jgi:hypothetical protein
MSTLTENWNQMVNGYDILFEKEEENEAWLHKFDAFQLVKRVSNQDLSDLERQDALNELVQGTRSYIF